MQKRGITRFEYVVVFLILSVLVFLLFPRPIAIWDGEFALSIHVIEHQPIDHTSLVFAYCWTEQDSNLALQDLDAPNVGYCQHKRLAQGGYFINLPALGRIENKTIKTYNHPLFLVVEYRTKTDGKPSRKKFSIPLGKGTRSISIDL